MGFCGDPGSLGAGTAAAGARLSSATSVSSVAAAALLLSERGAEDCFSLDCCSPSLRSSTLPRLWARAKEEQMVATASVTTRAVGTQQEAMVQASLTLSSTASVSCCPALTAVSPTFADVDATNCRSPPSGTKPGESEAKKLVIAGNTVTEKPAVELLSVGDGEE